MRNLTLTLICVLFCSSLMSQTTFEKSESFPEFRGWTKLTQLKNGNTGLLEVTKKEGVKFTLFNPARKKIATGKLALKDLEDNFVLTQIEGVYEIAGDVTAFFITYKDDNRAMPVLHRVIVSGTTGKLVSEVIVDQITRADFKSTMIKVETDVKGFTVEKDPDSDYYAVIKTNTLATETIDRVEVSHYGPDHKVINKAKYNTPSDKYKYTDFIAAYVHGSDYVLISAFAFNTRKSGGDEARYYVAQLNNGKAAFIQKELPYTIFDKEVKGYFAINKPKDLINMVLIIKMSQVNQNINPTSMELGEPYATDISKANDIYRNKMKRKEDFGGMILGSFIDPVGNITYLYQQLVFSSNGSKYGDVALVTMSPEGKEISSGVFPCHIARVGGYQNAFKYNDISKGRRIYTGTEGVGDIHWYFTMNFYSTQNGSYIFFNNRLENMDLPDTKEAEKVIGITGTNSFKYHYQVGKITKEFAFTKPANEKEAKFINPGASDFNASTKSYTTILTDPITKTSMVVWTQLD